MEFMAGSMRLLFFFVSCISVCCCLARCSDLCSSVCFVLRDFLVLAFCLCRLLALSSSLIAGVCRFLVG